MPDYFYDMDLVVDPLNPSNVVAKGQVAIYDPADTAGTTLLALKDPSGLPLPNPLTSNANGFLPPRIASVPQTLWKSGGFEGYFNSFKGLRDEAVSAVAAAQGAADAATTAVAEVVTTATVDGAGALVLTKANGSTVNAGSVRGPQGIQGAPGQNGSNVLPTDTAIQQAITTPGTATATALSATYATKWKPNTAYLAGDPVLAPTGEVVTAKIGFTSGATYNAGNWNSVAIPAVMDAADTSATVTKRLWSEDVAGAKGSQLNFEHWGDGTGKANGQTYALDIHNNPASKSAIVVHQYSNQSPAVRLDNTDAGTMLLIAQTNNPVRNPNSVAGTAATGAAIRQVDHNGVSWFALLGRGEIQMNPPADAGFTALEIVGNAANTRKLIRLTGKSTGIPLEIVQEEANTYGMVIGGKKYAASFTATESGGQAVRISRTNVTGSGDVLDLRNDSATGRTLLIRQGTTEVAKINVNGEYENVAAGAGSIYKSPDGTRYRLSVANGGTVSVVAA